jgi:hypothetical protein
MAAYGCIEPIYLIIFLVIPSTTESSSFKSADICSGDCPPFLKR